MTIRKHLEAIMRIAEQAPDYDHRACDIHTEAVAALKDLDEAERLGHLSQRIWPSDDRVAVPDPESSEIAEKGT